MTKLLAHRVLIGCLYLLSWPDAFAHCEKLFEATPFIKAVNSHESADYVTSPVSRRRINLAEFMKLAPMDVGDMIDHIRSRGVKVVFMGDSSADPADRAVAKLIELSKIDEDDFAELSIVTQAVQHLPGMLGVALTPYEAIVDENDSKFLRRRNPHIPVLFLFSDSLQETSRFTIAHEYAHLLFHAADIYSFTEDVSLGFRHAEHSLKEEVVALYNDPNSFAIKSALQGRSHAKFYEVLNYFGDETRFNNIILALRIAINDLKISDAKLLLECEVLRIQKQTATEFSLDRNEIEQMLIYERDVVLGTFEESADTHAYLRSLSDLALSAINDVRHNQSTSSEVRALAKEAEQKLRELAKAITAFIATVKYLQATGDYDSPIAN